MQQTIRYDSRQAVLDLLREPNGFDPAVYRDNPSFYGCSFADAVEYLEHGWVDGVVMLEDGMRRVTAHITQLTTQEDFHFDPIEGIGIDIGRYTSGQPDCWVAVDSMTVNTRGNRVLRVLYNPGSAAFTRVKDKETYGIMVAGAVYGLEQQGYRVELWSSYQFEGGTGGTRFDEVNLLIKLKEANEELKLAHLAFDTIHAAFQRRINFAVAHFNGYTRGIISHDSDTAYPWIEQAFEHDVYIPAVRRFVDTYGYRWTEQAAEECAIELLRRYQ